MRKYLLILIISICTFSSLKAQEENSQKRAEKIQALKIAFITQRLQLTPGEAQKFWPVYGQYDNDIKKLLGDKLNTDVIDTEERILNVRKRYRPEFEKVLGAARMNQLFTAEKEFRKVLINQLKNMRSQQTKIKN